MKATVIFGSPRKEGNTASLMKPFMDELKNYGAEIDFFDVYEKSIEGCRACMECQKNSTGPVCVVEDDMQPVLRSITACDLLIIAAPIYVWSCPAPVKAVMDRLIYSCNRYYGENASGAAYLKGKRVACITTCGYPVEKGIDLYEGQIKRLCKYCRMEYAGIIGERHLSLNEPFVTTDKEERARAFARELSGIKE